MARTIMVNVRFSPEEVAILDSILREKEDRSTALRRLVATASAESIGRLNETAAERAARLMYFAIDALKRAGEAAPAAVEEMRTAIGAQKPRRAKP